MWRVVKLLNSAVGDVMDNKTFWEELMPYSHVTRPV
jgi:hypothetical protein